MLSKFASMFLVNIFYNSKITFKVKKRDTRVLHSRICLYELYDVYFKIYSSFTDAKLHHSAKKLIVHSKFLKYPSLLVHQRQNVVLTTLYHLINFLDKLNCVAGVACVFG